MAEQAPPAPYFGDGAATVTISGSGAQKTEQPPTAAVDPAEAALRARYGGLLPKKKKLHGSSNALHQHFDSADWSMAKARGKGGQGVGGGVDGNATSSTTYSSSLLSVSSSELAPPKLAPEPEPPAPRRPSHLGEASK